MRSPTDKGHDRQRALTQLLEVELEVRVFAEHVVDERDERTTLLAEPLKSVHVCVVRVAERAMTYVPSVRQGLLQVDDAAEDEREDGSEVFPLVGTNGDLNEALGHGHAFVEIGGFQD